MAGVQWKYSTDNFLELRVEIASLFAKRDSVPAFGSQYYPFCDFIKNSNEWVINRHFFFQNIQDPFSGLDKIKSYNNKISVKDWIDNTSKYDLFVLDIITKNLLSLNIYEVEFCGLAEFNNGYSYENNRWQLKYQRSI